MFLAIGLAAWLIGPRAPASPRVAAIERLVREYLTKAHVPGASVAILDRGRVVYARGFGLANLEHRVPVTPKTLFPTASTAKLLTATAILQLVERGAIALDHPVQEYCSSFPSKRWPVTVAQLLTHQGGVRTSTGADVFNRVHVRSVTEAVGLFAQDSLLSEPGTRVAYSNPGYVLLACAVEGASGTRFYDYLSQRIFAPAGMSATVPNDLYRVIPDRADGYMVRTADNDRAWKGLWTEAHLAATQLDQPFRSDPLDESPFTGASNLVTTPTDLAKFLAALIGGQLVSPASLALMFADHLTNDGKPTGRGFGWMLGENGARLVGSVWTGSSAILLDQDRTLAVIVSTNLGFQQPIELLSAIAGEWKRPAGNGGRP